MNWKTGVLGVVVSCVALAFIAGCDKPKEAETTKKAPTPPATPVAPKTTDSK